MALNLESRRTEPLLLQEDDENVKTMSPAVPQKPSAFSKVQGLLAMMCTTLCFFAFLFFAKLIYRDYPDTTAFDLIFARSLFFPVLSGAYAWYIGAPLRIPEG